jgi:hypothetical protein
MALFRLPQKLEAQNISNKTIFPFNNNFKNKHFSEEVFFPNYFLKIKIICFHFSLLQKLKNKIPEQK